MAKTDKALTIRLSAELLEAMRALADQHNRSLNGEIITALGEYRTKYKPNPAQGGMQRVTLPVSNITGPAPIKPKTLGVVPQQQNPLPDEIPDIES